MRRWKSCNQIVPNPPQFKLPLCADRDLDALATKADVRMNALNDLEIDVTDEGVRVIDPVTGTILASGLADVDAAFIFIGNITIL